MNRASFRFYNELDVFLTPDRRGMAFVQHFEGSPSVKHLVEALGVPHTEVALIRVNGVEVDFSYLVQDQDRVEVYPVSMAGDGLNRWGQAGDPRFILDIHLGRLAAYLRMLGLDALYRNDYQDEELAQVAGEEKRILLTRDRRLLMRSVVTYGYWVRAKAPRQQLLEVVQRFDLASAAAPFRRCIRCNHILEAVTKDEILSRLEPLTRRYFDEFRICPACGQIFWKGSHYERMRQLIGEVLRSQ